MAAKWKIMLKPIETSDLVADRIVKAIFCLHNFLCDELTSKPLSGLADFGSANECNGLWRQQVQNPLRSVLMQPARANRSTAEAEFVRDNLQKFFITVGSVEWQNGML
uniref:Transposase n=1 Tax=Ditylenchus dipsaci TaxID=166011 RepID=A0A915CT21_9BILA